MLRKARIVEQRGNQVLLEFVTVGSQVDGVKKSKTINSDHDVPRFREGGLVRVIYRGNCVEG